MTYQHAIVWLDHREARIIDFTVDDANTTAVTNADDARRVNRKQNHQGAARQPDFTEFYNEVAEAFATSTEVLVVGPAEAKNEFVRHLEQKFPKRAAKVVGVETLDHPSDGQLLAFARKYFKRYDQVH